MPQLKFTGGPWDGVEFEAGFAPDALTMPNMHTYAGKNPETGGMIIGSNKPTEHHVYVFDGGRSDFDEHVYVYRYEKDGKPWWHGEIEAQQ